MNKSSPELDKPMKQQLDDKLNETQNAEQSEEQVNRSLKIEKRLRRLKKISLFAGIFFLAPCVLFFILYRAGYVDQLIKSRFIEGFDQIGIKLEIEKFSIGFFPFSLRLENVVAVNKKNGETLFRFDSADVKLTLATLFSPKTQIDVNSTEISGAEIIVKFDAEGRSNFSGLEFVEQEKERIKFNYASTKFLLKNSLIHFGDQTRKIEGEAKNINFQLQPIESEVSGTRIYDFNLFSSNSHFSYNEKRIESVELELKGKADDKGAEIEYLRIKSPAVTATLTGKIENWQTFRYDFNADANVDLTQLGRIFSPETALNGIGIFKGRVTGEGQNYKIEGEISTETLSVASFNLKSLELFATVKGKNSVYEASGEIIAEMLNSGEFQLYFPRLISEVRGEGNLLRFLMELQAKAMKSEFGTVSDLYISDAVAEYDTQKLSATIGFFSAESFSSEKSSISAKSLQAQNVRTTRIGERSITQIPKAKVQQFRYGNSKTNTTIVESAIAENTKIDSKGKKTEIETETLKAKKLRSEGVTLENLTAKGVKADLTQNGANNTRINAESLAVERFNAGQTQIRNLKARTVDLIQTGNETYLNSKLTEIGELNAYGAKLANLDIAGVRLSIRNRVVKLTSEDIEAGDVLLDEFSPQENLKTNGKLESLRLEKPVFVLEPSGRYRASFDISTGGGFIGNIKLGKARASITATNDQVTVSSITAEVMDGRVIGDAVISFNKQKNSIARFNFGEIDLSKFAVTQSGRILPISGKVNGTIELSFPETDFKSANGLIQAKITANTSRNENSKIPISGEITLVAENGFFSVNKANLETGKTKLLASGKFSLRDEVSNLNLTVFSADASEIQSLMVLSALSPELEAQLAENKIELLGNFYFDGKITGSLNDPVINGLVKLDLIRMRNQDLGSLKSDILVASSEIEIKSGKLEDGTGGYVAFDARIPQPIKDNISIRAVLENYNPSNLLEAIPLEDYIPENLRKIQARTSGEIILTGLPKKASGSITLNSTQGTIANQPFDSFYSQIILNEVSAKIERFELRQGEAFLVAKGTYDGESTEFSLNLEGKNLQVSKILAFIPNGEKLPAIDGIVNLRSQLKGEVFETSTYNISFSGEGSNVSIDGQTIGSVDFQGATENQLLKAIFAINYENSRQEIFAEVNFADETLPVKAYSNLDSANLTPFLKLYSTEENLNIAGTATGNFRFEGKFADKDAKGNLTFSLDHINGFFNLSALSLQINEIPLSLAEPLQIRFNSREIVFENAKFVSASSILSISGNKALRNDVANNLSVNGRVNLRLLDIFSRDTFFSGIADVSVRLTGLNRNSVLSGKLVTENASLSTFIGSERLDFERIRARVIFTANQIQIEEATGYLGNGKVVASGGALLKNLQLEGFRLDLVGRNITAPLPKDFITTGNAEITITSRRIGDNFDTLISGNIFARRSIYTKDVDIADVIGTRREASITNQGSTFSAPRLELNLIGRDALIVRNNIADLVASVDMKVTGDADNPILIGRITSNEGTLFYRDNKYSINRGTLEFPIQTDREPFITLQAETEIQSYQIAIDLRGELSDLSSMSLNIRSNPPLPQADIVSLITTGSLSNTETGIPTTAQSGINTAAEILTDALLNTPIRRATDRLFGLNRFEINPLISGIRQLPTARLTVGRQINRNLLVTYSTNLSEDQRQVIALEYRVSNRLSFIAQYQQKSLSNFVQERNSFNFEIRLRKRF